MAREIDESWIEEAIVRHQQMEKLRDEYERLVADHQVTVHSPDQSIELLVSATGEITDIEIKGPLHQRSPTEFAAEIQAVVTSAAEAARWAREKLHGEVFGQLRTLGED